MQIAVTELALAGQVLLVLLALLVLRVQLVRLGLLVLLALQARLARPVPLGQPDHLAVFRGLLAPLVSPVRKDSPVWLVRPVRKDPRVPPARPARKALRDRARALVVAWGRRDRPAQRVRRGHKAQRVCRVPRDRKVASV